MNRKVSKLRLSPNEEARIIREECERRRKLRIQQVREQQRHFALKIRREVEQKRQHEMKQLEEELRLDWERQQREKLHELQTLYQESLRLLGQGHRSAKENEPDLAAIAQREEENHAKAEERYREALKELKSQRLKNHERQNQFINARKKALQAEKERSAKVSSLPPPPPNPVQNINPKKPHIVKRSDVSAFAATHYHMPDSAVDREVDTEQPDAREEAELEVKRLHDLQRDETRKREEQLEKARLRGKEALRREQLVQDRERLLVELEHMQQTDLLRRRQQVSQMPPQIFQPLYKRQETRDDFQREMEFAFEDMYTGERRVKGDLVVRLVPEPLPAPSTTSQDQELDVTLDEVTTTDNTQHDTEEDIGSTEQETSAEVGPSRPAPRRALKKLLDRIRSQRSQWTISSGIPAADSPTLTSDQIPERDTSIETGSLSAEEKDKPVEPREPALSPPAAADTLLPDALADRIQGFEEERKKREEELEREKQQQVILLQELEEQKAKLEQMLLEAQQEREDLKAAVTQEEPLQQPEVPVREEEVSSVTPGVAAELLPPAGEDDHTRRIREYQQRLLDQNRIHQRSVEVARQRLEEYQRALRVRYNMAATTLQPPLVPPGLQPLLHSTRPVHPPLQTPTAYIHDEPQTSVEVNTRQPDMSASHLRRPGSSVFSKLPPDEVESLSHRRQRPEVTAWLTDSIMESVTEHLPDRLKSPSASKEPFKLSTTRLSTSIPLHPASDPIQTINSGIRDPPVSDPAAARHVSSPQISQQAESSSFTEDDMETQRRELQEVQRRMLQQREAVKLQQKQQEEERQRHQVEMEQMRRQKEALQALIQTDEEPVSETASDELVSENIDQSRLRLLASLLRAIEESNGGTLSHLEDTQEKEESPQRLMFDGGETAPIAQISAPAVPVPASSLPSGLPHPPRAAKPPVTRVRPGFMEMTEQHELSAIQEVETSVDTSQVTGPEDTVAAPSQTGGWNLQQESESHVTSDRTLQTPSVPSKRPTSSGTSSHLMWRKKLPMEAGTSPESSDSDSLLRIFSPLSSDSGRGADVSGPAVTSYRSPAEFPHRPPESDCFFSSTTISTGSYITTDPELNTDSEKSPPLEHAAEQQSEADLHDVSSPSGQSMKESPAAGSPGLDGDSLSDDSSIQRIIDRYMKELDISLSTAGKSTDSEGSYVEEVASSVSQPSLVRASSSRREDGNTSGAQRSSLELENPVDPIPSLTEDHDSFRPLIGQLAELSSCLAAPQRDSALEQLVGHPSAQSSAIGHLPGLPVSPSVGRWDATLSRMIGRLSHQSSSDWHSGGQNFQLMGQLEPSWLDEAAEESRMRPLVGELDESAGHHSGSSAERSHVVPGVQTEVGVPSHLTLPPEASSHSTSDAGVNPPPPDQTQQNRTSPVEMGSQRAEVFLGSDSFHPLLPEVTHNETADPSMTFHLPEHSAPSSPEASGDHSVSDPSAESEPRADLSVESEPSPVRLRTEKPTGYSASSPALHESFSRLVTSHLQPHESVLTMSPMMATDVQQTAQIVSNVTVCDDALSTSLPEVEICVRPEDSSSVLKSEQSSNLREAVSVSDKILEAAREKGILEQSEITLVSLTDSTLQDQDTTITEEDGLKDDRQEGQEMEGSESMLLPEDDSQTHPVTVLKFQWGLSKSLQDVHQPKLQALLQRSNRRVEQIKAKRALTKTQPDVKAPCEGREQPKASKAQPADCKAKTKTEVQLKADSKSKGVPAVLQTQENSGFIKQRKPQLPPAVSEKKVDEVKICTSEQRQRNVTKMHQRTRRLYEQLEEVKQQKAVRSRQEDGAKNRLKAKEFHKKTLQKLRAKQSRQSSTLNVS